MVNPTDSDPLTRYPLTLHLGDASLVLRLIAPADRDAIVDLARRQPPEDLLYLRRDLTRPEVVDEWLARAAAGQITVLVAQAGTGMAAYASIDRGDVGWTSHVRELRVLVDAEARARAWGGRWCGKRSRSHTPWAHIKSSRRCRTFRPERASCSKTSASTAKRCFSVMCATAPEPSTI